MAAIADMSLLPRYCPSISFPEPEGRFLLEHRHQAATLPRYDPAEVPKQALLESDHKTVADFVPIDGRLSMCREARDLVETLEPGVHQFFPVSIVRKRGKKAIYRIDGRVLDEPYYFFAPQVSLDAVCIERSEVEVIPLPNGQPPFVRRHILMSNYNVVLLRSVVAGHHVWVGDYHLPGELMFSDALVAAIEATRLRKLEIHYLAEV